MSEPPSALAARPLRVGLLGGSFNPAHQGHLTISLEALKRLDLDQVWWLVSPQNPLKSRVETAPLALRLARAQRVARHPRLWVKNLEARIGTRYTVHTLERLGQAWPRHRFVWLMGADNLGSLHQWYRWRDIAGAVPIAVFDREPYVYQALGGPAATWLASARVAGERAATLLEVPPPSWCLLRLRTHPAASSAIRARGEWQPQRAMEED